MGLAEAAGMGGRSTVQPTGVVAVAGLIGRRDSKDERKPAMKMIMAVIKPHKLEAVRDALTGLGVEGLTASEVKGFGRQGGHTEIYRGAEYAISFVPKVKIEIAVTDDRVDDVVEAIRNASHTGKIGDGKIFVYDMGRAVRIRTGEEDTEAL